MTRENGFDRSCGIVVLRWKALNLLELFNHHHVGPGGNGHGEENRLSVRGHAQSSALPFDARSNLLADSENPKNPSE